MNEPDLITTLLQLLALLITGHAVYSFLRRKKNLPDKENTSPWGALEAVTFTITVYFLSQIIVGALLYAYFQARGLDYTVILSDSPVVLNFVSLSMINCLMLALLFLFLERRGAAIAQLGVKKPKYADIGFAIGGFIVYALLFQTSLEIIKGLVPTLNVNQEQQLSFSTNITGWPLLLVFVSLVIVPPLVEEIVFRGFLYTGLRSKLPKLTAALITSIIFGAAHLQVDSGKPLLWTAAVDTFILSMVLVYIRDKTDRLWAPIGIHAIKNGLAFFLLFILPKLTPVS